jgi:hypothetical protein
MRRYAGGGGRRWGPDLLDVEVYSVVEFKTLLGELKAVHARHCARCARVHINGAFVTHLGVGLVTYQALSGSERTEAVTCINDFHARFCACREDP